MNKFELMNKVAVSNLEASNKALLIELILRSDDKGESFPSVERLCQVKRIKHEKNFKGADFYLPGLVTVERRGRGGNKYTLNVPAIEGLNAFEVVLKHTEDPAVAGTNSKEVPALEGTNSQAETQKDPALAEKDPAVADLVPAPADLVPAVEGANSTQDNTRDSSIDSSVTTTPQAAGSEEEFEPDWGITDEELEALEKIESLEPSLTTMEEPVEDTRDELDRLMDEYESEGKKYPSYDANYYAAVRRAARLLHDDGLYAQKAIGQAFQAVPA